MPYIIGLVGEKLSGKGTVSDYLQEKYSAKHYRFSKILEDICERLYLPNTRENMIDVALSLRDKFGNEILAHVLKKDIEEEKPEYAVIDGIRYWEEYNILKNLEGFVFIYVTAPMEKRYERVKSRGEKQGEENLSFEDFKEQEQGPTEKMISELAQEARYTINNNGSLEDLYKEIENIL